MDQESDKRGWPEFPFGLRAGKRAEFLYGASVPPFKHESSEGMYSEKGIILHGPLGSGCQPSGKRQTRVCLKLRIRESVTAYCSFRRVCLDGGCREFGLSQRLKCSIICPKKQTRKR